MRDVRAIVTGAWRGLRWTLAASVRCKPCRRNAAAYGEVVWSWRRDPGATLVEVLPPATGARKAASPGRARISRKTIARGKPGCLGCTCQIRVRSFTTIAHGAAGAVGARLSLRPLDGERDKEDARLGQKPAARSRKCVCFFARPILRDAAQGAAPQDEGRASCETKAIRPSW